MWNSWDEVSETYRAWTTWDDWIFAAYRGRIDFESFREKQRQQPPPKLTDEEKAAIFKNNRAAILDAIKKNQSGEHYNWQTFLHILSKLCIFLIATSSGLVISDILGAHLGLTGVVGYLVGLATFIAVFASNVICFRVSVPDVIRRLFEGDKSLRWHFKAATELSIYKNLQGEVKAGYFQKVGVDVQGKPIKDYRDIPDLQDTLGWKSTVFLLAQFVLGVIVGSVLLAQTVDKAKGGLKGLMPFLIGLGVASPVAWVMGVAAFVCMLGQYTYSVIRFLRQEDKRAELWRVFRRTDEGKGNWPEVCVHNALMFVVVLSLSFFVALGIYGTSEVQATSFMNLINASKNGVAHLALTICTIGGKLLFTVRALFNFVGILRSVAVGLWNKAVHGESFSPFDNRAVEDKLTFWEYAAVLMYAAAKSTTAVPTPESGETSALFSDNILVKFFAWVSSLGAFIRAAQEPLDKVKPKQVDTPEEVKKDRAASVSGSTFLPGYYGSPGSPNLNYPSISPADYSPPKVTGCPSPKG